MTQHTSIDKVIFMDGEDFSNCETDRQTDRQLMTGAVSSPPPHLAHRTCAAGAPVQHDARPRVGVGVVPVQDAVTHHVRIFGM